MDVMNQLYKQEKVMDYLRDTTDIDGVEKEITRISNLPIDKLVRYINNTVLPCSKT